MGLTLFEKTSAWFGSLTGFYSYGKRNNEPGIYINHAVAKNFGLYNGMISETALDEFVMRSIGGVNGRKMRHGEQLMFKRHDGTYSAVTYEPMHHGKRGYVHEIRVKTTGECLPLSALPNFSRLCENAEYRAGDLFCVISISPYENRGETFDYAAIAEFFDSLRKRCAKPSVLWLGDREYVLMIKPEQRDELDKLCKEELLLDGRAVTFSVIKAYIEPRYTDAEQAQKIAFCLKKIRSGSLCGDYYFDHDEFERAKTLLRDASLSEKIKNTELSFLPVVSVKSGKAKYFYVAPKDASLKDSAIFSGLRDELDCCITEKLTEGIRNEKFPKLPYCISVCADKVPTEKIALLAKESTSPIYVEICARAHRIDKKIWECAEKIKLAGAIPVIFDPQMNISELSAVQRMGFRIIRVFGQSTKKLKGIADFCRVFGIECAVHGVDLDEDFINLRRSGVDLCAGNVLSEAVDVPTQIHFCEPHVICEEEENEEEPEPAKEPEPFDPSRFAAKMLCSVFSDEINSMIAPRKCPPMDKMECTEKTDPLEPIGKSDLVPCEYEKGIGSKKEKKKKHKDKEKHKHKKEKSDKKKKKLQKKEIKKGKLKKIKLEKK